MAGSKMGGKMGGKMGWSMIIRTRSRHEHRDMPWATTMPTTARSTTPPTCIPDTCESYGNRKHGGA